MATCSTLLGGIITVINGSTKAWDRRKNGTKYFDDVCTQIEITKQILETVIKVETELHTEYIAKSVELIKLRAEDLKNAANQLAASKSGFGTFLLHELIPEVLTGNAKAAKFDEKQRNFIAGHTILISSMLVCQVGSKHVAGTNTVQIDMNIVNRVNERFKQFEGLKGGLRILDIINTRGTPVDEKFILWQIREEDLAELSKQLPSEIVRIIRDNEVNEFGMVTADVGKPGEDAPHVDRVVAERNKVSGSGLLAAGPMAYDTMANLQGIRTAMPALVKERPEEAANMLKALIPGLKK